jgi:hypothetical protein
MSVALVKDSPQHLELNGKALAGKRYSSMTPKTGVEKLLNQRELQVAQPFGTADGSPRALKRNLDCCFIEPADGQK